MGSTPPPTRVIGTFKCLIDPSNHRFEIVEAVDDFSVIPETIENYPVRAISDLFLCHCIEHLIPIPPFISTLFNWPGSPFSLSSIEFPPTIEEIRFDRARQAATRFSSLTELVFSRGSRHRHLFGLDWPSVSEITLPPSVERVNAFSNCSPLREIHFSEAGALRELDGFANLPSLFQVTIPSSVTVIGDYGFYDCRSLTDVTFAQQSALTEILGFDGCRLLSRIEIPSSVTELAGFNRCHRLAHVAFAAPSRLRLIDGFTECFSLRRIEIPAGVQTIGVNAFEESLSLEEVIFVGESEILEFRCSAFHGARIEIPPRLTDIAAGFFDPGFVWVRRSTAEWDLLVRMDNSACRVNRARGVFSFVPRRIVDGGAPIEVTSISDSLLAVAPSEALLPSIVEIQSGSPATIFVKEIAIPESIEIVDGFSGWDCLESVKFAISGKLRDIRGFCECNSLRRIEIPDSVELIGSPLKRAGFVRCAALAEVIFAAHGHLRQIGGFCDCDSLARIAIPVSVEVIDGFNQCARLAEVTFAADGHLRRIDGFCDCVSLARIDIPASVEGVNGFNGCKLLSGVEFAALGRLKEINGFQECESLREVEIPQSVVQVWDCGFCNCRRLRKVTLASECHLKMIAGFHGCPVDEIVIPAGGRAPPLSGRVYITFVDEASIAQRRRNFRIATSGVATSGVATLDSQEYSESGEDLPY
jgi:hypothetical protein